ncbi:MAG: 50S ribosomal protein L10, partial [candidate division NC10 bacterium]|nr:50S ribosomal protein L10 [candidate division NC10 bacterium]
SAVLTDFRGLSVADLTELRRQLREGQVEFRVVKNTLARRATAAVGLTSLHPLLEGPTAIAFGRGDPLAPSRLLSRAARALPHLQIKGGVLEGKVVSREEVLALAALPPRPVLLSRLVGVLQAPITRLAGALGGTLRGLVVTLDQVRGQLERAQAKG